MRWTYVFVLILALSFVAAVAGVSGAFDPRPGPTPFPTPSCLPLAKGAPAPIRCCPPGLPQPLFDDRLPCR